MFELFKNAMRAVVENCDSAALPPVTVTIVKGSEDVCIKVRRFRLFAIARVAPIYPIGFR